VAATSSATLVGRARELAALRGLVATARDGAGAVALVEGEAGIGKSRLLGSLLDEARADGVTVLRGEAHALERTRPFGALVEALELRAGSRDPRRAAIGRLLAAAGERSAGRQFAVAEDVVELLEVLSRDGPVLLALEDLHWADSATLLSVRWMARRLDHVGVLLIATLRPAPRSGELAQVVDDVLDAGAAAIRLAPFAEDEVDRLVRAEAGLPPGPALRRAVDRAGGNPLWIVEMLRALSAEGMLEASCDTVEMAPGDLPESLRQLVVRRLGWLPDATVELLRVASVLGGSFSLVDLAALTGRRVVDLAGGLGPAFEARLVGGEGTAVTFRHALVHDAVYRAVPEPVRVTLHREAARALADRGAPLDEVAGHAFLGAHAGDLEVVALLRRAAREAAPRAPGVAVELLRRAESLLPDRHPERDRVVVELVEALLRAGRVAEAAGIAEAVLARPHDPGADMPLRLSLMEALSLQNRPRELLAQGQATLALVPRLSDAEQALVLAQAGLGHTFAGDPRAGEHAARRALALAETAADAPMTVWSLTTLAVAVRTQGRYAEALELTDRAVRTAFTAGDEAARLRHPLFFRGLALTDADRLDEATAAYRAAVEECEALRSAWLLPDVRLMAAELRFLRGEWDDADPELEAAGEGAAEQGARILVAQSHGYRAIIAAARADRAGAARALAPVRDVLEGDRPPYGAEVVALAASLLAEASGDPQAARDVLWRAWQRCPVLHHRHLGPPLVRLLLEAGAPDRAREVTCAVAAAAELAPEVPSARAAAARCRGLVEDDPERLLEAVDLARRAGRVLDHAAGCEDAASVLGAAGRREEARALLTEAIDRYEELGAAALSARAGAALRAAGGRRGARGPRLAPGAGWAGLTPTERAVAELVAEGLTNREVAKRLYISPHTVNSHLRQIFRKLGVANRVALAAKVHSIE